MAGGFADSIRQLIYFARAEMVRLGKKVVSLDSLVLGMLRSPKGMVSTHLIHLGVSLDEFRSYLESNLAGSTVGTVSMDDMDVDFKVPALLKLVRDRSVASSRVATDLDVLYTLLERGGQTASSLYLLSELQLSLDSFRVPESESESGEADEFFNSPKTREDKDHEDFLSRFMSDDSRDFDLMDYCTDLTESARKGDLDPVVGRERELDRMIQVLCRRTKNNPVLVGEPGVGKTALVEGLAARIASGGVPLALRAVKLLMLDLNSMVAGTRYRGDFEDRMQQLIRHITENPNYILFIDEVHTLVGSGSAEGTLDGANILKPVLARGLFRCIGATTHKEYKRSIEVDGALDRRFQRISVPATSSEETIRILEALRSRYESFHKVVYHDSALAACVHLTERYLPERSFPDKAIDALDETGARAAVRREVLEGAFGDGPILVVDETMVAETVSQMANVPVQRVSREEGERLLGLEADLESWIVGQREAIERISKAIRRNRSGLRDPRRPVGSFLFMGSTGVGKTSLAKALARVLFDSPDHFIRMDMSEYNERFSISRLLGAPPGYVGYGEGGQLTERVRLNPYSVVLFDEIEKAAPDVYNVLLQVLDEGMLTDGHGRTIDFTHTIIIMTSNVGSRAVQEYGSGVGYMTTAREDGAETHRRGMQQKALERHFPPEFLNRVDELVYFRELTMEDMPRILDVHLRGMLERLQDRGIRLRLTPKVREFVLQEGYDAKYGARPLKRAVQQLVEDPVVEFLLREQVSEGDTVVLNYSKQRGVYASLQRAKASLAVPVEP